MNFTISVPADLELCSLQSHNRLWRAYIRRPGRYFLQGTVGQYRTPQEAIDAAVENFRRHETQPIVDTPSININLTNLGL